MTEFELNEAIRLYEEGKSHEKIAKILGYKSGCTIGNWLKKAGIKARSNIEKSMKYYCNENYFKKINSEEKAYWLGFIYADGYITSKRKHNSRKFGVSLSIQDIDHLEKLKGHLEATYPIKTYISKGGYSNKTEYCRLLITNGRVTDDLEKLGVFEKKSLILEFPNTSILPKEYIFHFIRGYFDGDGSIVSKANNAFSFSLCGTYEFLMEVQKHIGTNYRLGKRHENNKNTYQLNFGGNRIVERILDKLYKDSTLYLDRKFVLYMKLRKTNENVDILVQEKEEELLYKDMKIIDEFKMLRSNDLVAKKLNISPTTVTDALKRRNMYHLKEDVNKQKLTDSVDFENKILKIYNSGIKNKTKIGKMVGCCTSTVINVLKKHGIIDRECLEKSKNEAHIIELYTQGLNKTQIHLKTGYSRDYIRKVINNTLND